MFSRNLGTTPTLCGGAANLYFADKITGEHFRDDYSFVATLRALLLNRIGDGSIRFLCNRSTYSAEQLSRMENIDDMFGTFYINSTTNDTIRMISLEQNEAANIVFEKFDAENGFVANKPGYTEQKDLAAFAGKIMNARFYINEAERTTIVIVEKLDLRRYHYLQAIIPRLVPWFFKDKNFSDEERNLMKSLLDRRCENYQEIIEVFASKIDLRSISVKMVLGDFEKRARKDVLDTMMRQLEDIHARITENLAEYSRYITQLDDANLRVAGAQAAIDEAGESSELMDYFIVNKSLHPLNTRGKRLRFMAKGFLEFFDPEMYASMSKKESSHIFSGYTVENECFKDWKDRKKFLDAVFSDEPVLKIKVCGYYDISVSGDVETQSGFSIPRELEDCMPNPHLYHYACLGDHSRYIRDFLLNGDIIGAIEQCVTSARSINVGESITMQRFLGNLFDKSEKVIVLPDGSSVAPADALRWLNENEAKEEDHG